MRALIAVLMVFAGVPFAVTVNSKGYAQEGDVPEECDIDGALTIIGEFLTDPLLDPESIFAVISDFTRDMRLDCGLYTPIVTVARDTGTCDEEDIALIVDYMDSQTALIATGDNPRLALRNLYWVAGSYSANCTGLIWTQDDAPGKRLVGPVNLRGGVYTTRMVSSSGSTLTVDVNVIEGNCGLDIIGAIVIAAQDGEEEAFQSNACTVLFELNPSTPHGVEPEWTFTITNLTNP